MLSQLNWKGFLSHVSVHFRHPESLFEFKSVPVAKRKLFSLFSQWPVAMLVTLSSGAEVVHGRTFARPAYRKWRRRQVEHTVCCSISEEIVQIGIINHERRPSAKEIILQIKKKTHEYKCENGINFAAYSVTVNFAPVARPTNQSHHTLCEAVMRVLLRLRWFQTRSSDKTNMKCMNMRE